MPTPGSSSSTTVGGASQPFSFALTVDQPSGNNRLVVLMAGIRGTGTDLAGVALNGQGPSGQLPDVDTAEFGNAVTVQRFYWLDADLPASAGSYNITGTTNGGAFLTGLGALSTHQSTQAAPTAGAGSTDTGTPTTSSTPVTSTEDAALIVDCLHVWHSSIAGVTPTAGQTEFVDVGPSGSDRFGCGYEVAGAAGAYAQTWSWSGSANLYAAAAMAINPAGASPSVPAIVPSNLASGVAGTPFNITLTGAASRGVVVMVDSESTSHSTSVTVNGASATLVVDAQNTTGAGNSSDLWVYFPPDALPAGSYAVSVSHPTGGAAGVRAVELNNIRQVVPSGAQVAEDDAGAASSMTSTPTIPAAASIAVGIAGHGNDSQPFNGSPSGDGTWTRLFNGINPPTSAHFVGAYQLFDGGEGAQDYTETAAAPWNRASQCVAVFEVAPVGGNTSRGHNF